MHYVRDDSYVAEEKKVLEAFGSSIFIKTVGSQLDFIAEKL